VLAILAAHHIFHISRIKVKLECHCSEGSLIIRNSEYRVVRKPKETRFPDEGKPV
jgi:hypothetical protein